MYKLADYKTTGDDAASQIFLPAVQEEAIAVEEESADVPALKGSITMRSITVDDCMTRSVIILQPDIDIVEAIRILLKHNITAAPVVNSEGLLVGILSETDCLSGTLTSSYYSQESGLVSEFMQTHVVTAKASDSIVSIYEQCMAEKALRIPVMNDDGSIAGMLSPKDLMEAVLEYYEKPVALTS